MKYAALLLFAVTLTLIAQVTKGDKPPVPIFKPDPEYTEEARKARIEGDVQLSAEIDEEGRTSDIRVTKPLGHGLDEKAIECVSKWRFKPAFKQDGTPFVVRADLKVEFRLENSK